MWIIFLSFSIILAHAEVVDIDLRSGSITGSSSFVRFLCSPANKVTNLSPGENLCDFQRPPFIARLQVEVGLDPNRTLKNDPTV